MLGRITVLGLAATLGLVARCPAASPPDRARPGSDVRFAMADADDKPSSSHGTAKAEGKDDDDKKGEKAKTIEQAVQMDMVPAGVLDAVKKECPGGKITEAELTAKKGKIMWSFDVTVGEAKYDVKVTVDGKFYEKKADDDDGDQKK